ncbi:MAG: lysophospholipase L1-like esterase [Rubritalea sp.]
MALKFTSILYSERMKFALLLLCLLLSPLSIYSSLAEVAKKPNSSDHSKLLENAQKIIMLGDSITYAGSYVVNFETWLTLTYPKKEYSLINLGLSSETVSGLSEKGHAGGRFPRPDLHERLDRILGKTKPDLIFACYGMNCAIYQALDKARFQKYQQGMINLKEKAAAAGAKIVFITPPYFDAQRNKNKVFYTDVLKRYSAWLVAQRKKGWNVIDLNTHMAEVVQEKRETDPIFTYQKDAVHPNEAGHWVMTQPILVWFGDQKSADCKNPQQMVTHLGASPETHELITQRSHTLRNAWLTETGHKRPGVRKGLPMNQAEKKVALITKAIRDTVKPSQIIKPALK